MAWSAAARQCWRCFQTTTRSHLSLRHAALLVFPYSNNLRCIYSPNRLCGLSDPTAGATLRWLCFVIVADWRLRGAGLTAVIQASFYRYNDFACCSNNKYLCRSIPVR